MAAHAERRAKERRDRRAWRKGFGLKRYYKTKEHGGSEKIFPPLSQSGAGSTHPAGMIYRGMSVNNIRNLQKAKEAEADDDVIFDVQHPDGKATVEEHVRDDAENSPFLSFEKEGYEVSAGKYAPKPVFPRTARPMHVTKRKGGFLKQRQSYKTWQREKTISKLGYVGGVKPGKEAPMVDISDEKRASEHLKDEESIKRAVADREILLRPGAEGVPRRALGFVAKVKQVPKAYFEKHVGNQTRDKSLGIYRPYGEAKAPEFYKLQIDRGETDEGVGFDVPKELMREEEDSTDEMSDIEEMDFSDVEKPERPPSPGPRPRPRRSSSSSAKGKERAGDRPHKKWSRSPRQYPDSFKGEPKKRDWSKVRLSSPSRKNSFDRSPPGGWPSASTGFSSRPSGSSQSSRPAYSRSGGGPKSGHRGYSSSSGYRASPPPRRRSSGKPPPTLSPRKSEKATATVSLALTASPRPKQQKMKPKKVVRPQGRSVWDKKDESDDSV